MEKDLDDDGEDEVDDFDDLWDAFTEEWDKAFKKYSEAEDNQLRKNSEAVQEVSANRMLVAGAAIEAKALLGEQVAKHEAKLAQAVSEAESAHKVREVTHSGVEARASALSSAFRDSDDTLNSIEAQMEQHKLEQARRREEAAKKAKEERLERDRRRRAAAGPSAAPPPPPRQSGGPAGRSSFDSARGPEAKAKPKAAAAAPAPTPKPKVFASFGEYNAAWSAFEQKLKAASSATPHLGMADIPWPNGLLTVSGIVAGDAKAEKKQKLKAAVLRWHPDKWAPVLSAVRDQERAEVIQKVQEVTRRILDEKKLHSK